MRERTSVIRLPAVVGVEALESLLDAWARAASPHILDFGSTDHIDYRAFRRFARRVRSMAAPERPILLAGLSPYCEEVVRFALGPGDWDVFLGAADGAASKGGDRADAHGGDRADADGDDRADAHGGDRADAQGDDHADTHGGDRAGCDDHVPSHDENIAATNGIRGGPASSGMDGATSNGFDEATKRAAAVLALRGARGNFRGPGVRLLLVPHPNSRN